MPRYNFKKQAIQEGHPWNEWSSYDREQYRKTVRLENARQGKIKFIKELLNDPLYQDPQSRYHLLAEIDILENKMDLYDAFNHRYKFAIKGYIEAINV